MRTLPAHELRHSHASALHYAGVTVPEAAERMGHSQVVHVDRYAHVMRTLHGERTLDLDALIDAARGTPMFRQCPAGEPLRARFPCKSQGPRVT